jgi:hypothetical protein
VIVLFVFPFLPLWMIAGARWMDPQAIAILMRDIRMAWHGK